MDAITTNQASQMLDSLLESVTNNVEPMIICNDMGNKAVLMSLDEFNSWQETLYLLSNPANAEHLYQSIREVKFGNTFEKELIIE
ncbi:antitoxin [Achromatium sp. WMS3]|nr:antitoxin [Achromatium sp. WMS3]